MKRYYYIAEQLDTIASLEHELGNRAISTVQFHVLSQQDADVTKRKLHGVEAVLRKDVVRSMKAGAIIGIVVATTILAAAYFLGFTASQAGWIPFIFLAIVLLGFCAWEGGFKGIQEPHAYFKQFEPVLREGKHVFFVDIDPAQAPSLEKLVQTYPDLHPAGTGKAVPHWFVRLQTYWKRFLRRMP